MNAAPMTSYQRFVALGLLIVLAGCSADPDLAESFRIEGIEIVARVTRGSPPEVKIQTARDLLTHASKYDSIISGSTRSIGPARDFQRHERQTAAILMDEAAGDYAKRQDHTKARDVYNAILSSFPGDDFGLVREAAESSLKHLDTIQKRAE